MGPWRRLFRQLVRNEGSALRSMLLGECVPEDLRQQGRRWARCQGARMSMLLDALQIGWMRRFWFRMAEHELEEIMKHTAAPDALASGLTGNPKVSGSALPRTRGADARRARGYLPAIRLPARSRPRRIGAKLNIMRRCWYSSLGLSNHGNVGRASPSHAPEARLAGDGMNRRRTSFEPDTGQMRYLANSSRVSMSCPTAGSVVGHSTTSDLPRKSGPAPTSPESPSMAG